MGEDTAQWRVGFVIPTYNEVESVGWLLERLAKLYSGPGTRLLVVDDDSPDGTGEVVRRLVAGASRVMVTSWTWPSRTPAAVTRRNDTLAWNAARLALPV